MTLGQGQEMTLTIQYAHIFIISIGFRSQAAKVLKNQQFSPFPLDKPI